MLDNETLNGMKEGLLDLLAKKESLDKAISTYKSQITEYCQNELAEKLADKDEPFGTVNIGPFSFNVPKKVEWDQSKLEILWTQIQEGGENPYEYMNTIYKVKETAFKNWPTSIQNAFIPARTIQPGAVALKIKDSKDA